MITTWDWSLESEANRLLHEAHYVSSGFFRLHHFYPLSWEPKVKYVPQGVYFPNLSYSSIPDFWHQVKYYDPTQMTGNAKTAPLQAELVKLLTPLHLTPPDHSHLQAEWDQLSPKLEKLIHELAPFAPRIESLSVHLSYFGTGGSFSLSGSDPAHVIVDLRLDQTTTDLAECLLTSLTRPYLTAKMHASWEESEFLVDYLLSHSPIAQVLKQPHQGTIPTLRTHVADSVITRSQSFLESLGAPLPNTQTFSLKHNTIHFGDCPLSDLSAREHAALAKLVAVAPAPVSTDELADLLFPDPDKFSLAALTKFVERLRHKLEGMGISRHYLATASGVGYYLKN